MSSSAACHTRERNRFYKWSQVLLSSQGCIWGQAIAVSDRKRSVIHAGCASSTGQGGGCIQSAPWTTHCCCFQGHLHSSPCNAPCMLPCRPALPCPALPCPALPCPALLCSVLLCNSLTLQAARQAVASLPKSERAAVVAGAGLTGQQWHCLTSKIRVFR